MIHFLCPRCQASLKVPDNAAGRKGPCPKCGQRLQVPQPRRNRTVLGVLPDTPHEKMLPEVEMPLPAAPVDRPRPRMALGTRLGCVALFVLGIATAAIGVVVTVKLTEGRQEEAGKTSANASPLQRFTDWIGDIDHGKAKGKTQPRGSEGRGTDPRISAGEIAQLADHPFWRKKLTAKRIEEIITQLTHPGRITTLWIDDTGKTKEITFPLHEPPARRIGIDAGTRSRAEAVRDLKRALDQDLQRRDYESKFEKR